MINLATRKPHGAATSSSIEAEVETPWDEDTVDYRSDPEVWPDHVELNLLKKAQITVRLSAINRPVWRARNLRTSQLSVVRDASADLVLISDGATSADVTRGNAFARALADLPTHGVIERIDRIVARLRSVSPLTYSAAIAARIEDIIEDWPSPAERHPPSAASLRALIRFLEDHRFWPKPRLYADADGAFEAEWADDNGRHLALQFGEGRKIRVVLVEPGRLVGQSITSVFRLHLADLPGTIKNWSVEEWIGAAA